MLRSARTSSRKIKYHVSRKRNLFSTPLLISLFGYYCMNELPLGVVWISILDPVFRILQGTKSTLQLNTRSVKTPFRNKVFSFFFFLRVRHSLEFLKWILDWIISLIGNHSIVEKPRTFKVRFLGIVIIYRS